MPPKRSRVQGTGETTNMESISQRSENPNLTAAQIAQLVSTTVEQILANRPESHPPPDQQAEEVRKLWEEIARLREERSSVPPPLTTREILAIEEDDEQSKKSVHGAVAIYQQAATEHPVKRYIVPAVAMYPVARSIQSRATMDPVEGYSALHIQSTNNSAEAQSSCRHEPAAKQLTIYEELSKLDVNC
ncbi:zinc ion binding protein [Dorcoceras hygrometricum]|uniref:Zinc ion binding protein n=1 Tax=Dorcoceras hygrometricum TaxID=472368 RepID=A0A2Z7D1G4_9LAMI|nr:zinc ion binding protein [Dorcoceras hygrometricum]